MSEQDLLDFASRETQRQDQTDALTQSLAGGTEHNPDEYAKALTTAAQTGTAPAWAKEFRPQLERKRKIDPLNVDSIIRSNPKTAAFLATPDNAAVAHDDIGNLTKFERIFDSLVKQPLRSMSAAPGMVRTGVFGALQGAAEAGSLVTDPLINVMRGLTGLEIRDPMAETAGYFNKLRTSATAEAAYNRGDVTRYSQLAQSVYSGFESAGQSLLTLPLAIATGNPWWSLVPMGIQTGGQSFGEAREKGVSVPQALTYAASQGAIEVATELIPVRSLIKNLGLGTSFVKTLTNQIYTENIGEQVATALQDLNDWAILPANAQKSFKDYLLDRPNAALQTFIATMVGTVIQTGAAKGVQAGITGQEHKQNKAIFDALAQTATDSKLRQRLPDKFRQFIEDATKDGPVREVLVPVEQFDKYFQTQEMDPAVVAGQLQAGNYAEAKLAGLDVAIPIGQFAEKIAASPHFAGLSEDLKLHPGELTARQAAEATPEMQADLTERMQKVVLEQEAQAPLDRAISAITDNVAAQLEAVGVEPKTARDQATVMRGVAIMASRAFPEISPLDAAMQAWEHYGLQVTGPVREQIQVDLTAAKGLAAMRKTGQQKTRPGMAAEVPMAATRHILELTKAPTEVEYKGKKYTEAIKEGENLRLKGDPDVVLTKPEDILQVEEAVPFDVPASEAITKFFQPAYHGSPHTFDKFDISKVGTGEGAQVYGHGLYFAENRAVAEQYHRELALQKKTVSGETYDSDNPIHLAASLLRTFRNRNDPRAIAIKELEHDINENTLIDIKIKHYQQVVNILKSGVDLPSVDYVSSGGIYTVDIPDEQVAKFLDWDKPLSEQAPEVKAALESQVERKGKTIAFKGEAQRQVAGALLGDLTGRELYQTLSATGNEGFGAGDQGASMYLNRLGIPGIKYLDQGSRSNNGGYQVRFSDGKETNTRWKTKADAEAAIEAFRKRGRDVAGARIEFIEDTDLTRNLVVFDPSIITEVKRNGEVVSKAEAQKFLQSDLEKQARASIEFTPERQATISLLENRNLSSFIHETGHFYLEALGDFAAIPTASQQIKDDYQTILDWFGRKSRADITTAEHEKFARAFELYLREGKAPAAGLRGVFQRFKAWLSLVYRQAKDLNVTINDEVRQVFDRILASDQEIEFAKSQMESNPIFVDAKTAGMTDSEFGLYTKATADELADAKDNLQQQLMREYERTLKREWKAELSKVKKEVGVEADALPVYRAADTLTAGKLPDGSPAKLNRASIVGTYGKDIADKLPRRAVTAAGNMDAEAAASIFGFTSGDALIKALAEMEPKAAYVERRANETMIERHGDMLADGTIANRAVEALHNEKRATVIRMELQALRRRQGLVEEVKGPMDRERRAEARQATEVPPTKFFLDAARQIIDQTPIRNLEPFRYLQAEKTASREAFKAMAKEDFDVAAESKRRELLAHYLYTEGIKAKADADAILKYAEKFNTTPVRQAMGKAGADYLVQIDSLLNRYEFRRVPIVQLERRQALSEWIAQEEAQGRNPVIDSRLVDESRRQNYRDIPIDELRAVRDAIRNIEHLARLKNKLAYKQKQIDFAEAKGELTTAAVDNIGQTLQLYSESARPLSENAKQVVKGLDAGIIKIEQLMMWLDGDKVNGPWHRYIWNPLKEAQHELNDDTKKVVEKIDALTKSMPKAWRKGLLDKVQLDGDSITRTRKDLIGMALNLGNEQNREKMVNGNFGGNVAMVERIKSRLTIQDWNFVQGIWNIIGELRPKIGAIEKRLTGLEPVWVEATPFGVTDADGRNAHLDGGYYPLVADKHSGVGIKQEADIFEESYVYPVTSHGFTKTRTKAIYPLDFNFDEIVQHHFVKVIKDYSHREAVLAANKILLDQDIRNTLISTLGEKYEPLFRGWLKDIANDSNRSIAEGMSTWGRLFTATRANVVAATMGFKATTIVSQIFGLAVSLDRVNAKPLTKSLLNYIANPLGNTRAAYDESGEMRHRANNIDRDIRQRLNAIIGKHKVRDDVQRVAFHGIAVVDSMVAVITWHGAKQQALAEDKTREEAILAADAAVRLTQGASSIMDQSAMVRNRGEFWRSITMFYGFFNGLYSVGRDIGFQVNGSKDLPRALSRAFLAFVVPQIVGDLILLRGPGGDDDDESYLGWAVRKALLSPFATIPFGRDVASAVDFFLSKGAKGQFEISFSPVAAAVEKIGRLGAHVARDLTGDKDIDFVKYAEEVAESVGFTFGVPGTAQTMATGRYLKRVGEGTEEPDNLFQMLYEAGIGKRRD